MNIVNLAAQSALLDQPISGGNYDEITRKVDDMRKKLSPQESLDLSIAVNYLESKGENCRDFGLLANGYKSYLYEMLNGCTARKIILISSGMMLSECVGNLSVNDINAEENKSNYQRRDYINKTRSYGAGFVKIYGKLAGPEKGP